MPGPVDLNDGGDPLVTVVIPNHDYARYVGQAVDSALGQTYTNVEVLVVDNGSSDDSLDVLAAYGDRIKVVAQADLGQSGGRNRGILEARGEWVAFLDADDVWQPTKLEHQMAVVRRSGPELGLVYCSMQMVDADLRPGEVLPARFRGSVLAEFVRHPGWAIVQGGESTAVVRREAFVRAGVFDPSLSIGAGWDLWRRIATLYEVDYVDDALVLYRQHGTNLHARTGRYEQDLRYMNAKMFADPMAAPVVLPFHRSYSVGVDLMLAKAWWTAKERGQAMRVLAGLPLRALRRPSQSAAA